MKLTFNFFKYAFFILIINCVLQAKEYAAREKIYSVALSYFIPFENDLVELIAIGYPSINTSLDKALVEYDTLLKTVQGEDSISNYSGSLAGCKSFPILLFKDTSNSTLKMAPRSACELDYLIREVQIRNSKALPDVLETEVVSIEMNIILKTVHGFQKIRKPLKVWEASGERLKPPTTFSAPHKINDPTIFYESQHIYTLRDKNNTIFKVHLPLMSFKESRFGDPLQRAHKEYESIRKNISREKKACSLKTRRVVLFVNTTDTILHMIEISNSKGFKRALPIELSAGSVIPVPLEAEIISEEYAVFQFTSEDSKPLYGPIKIYSE